MTRWYPLRGTTAALLLAAFGTSCSMDCTLIGCDDGLQVNFGGDLPTGGRVTASADGQAVRTFVCSAAQPCSVAFFRDFTPDRVSITIESPAGSSTRSFTPTYRNVQPNGQLCGPTCLIAQIAMQVP